MDEERSQITAAAPAPCPLPLTLLRAERNPYDLRTAWIHLVGKAHYRECVIPGDHYELFSEARLPTLAEALHRAVERLPTP